MKRGGEAYHFFVHVDAIRRYKFSAWRGLGGGKKDFLIFLAARI